MGDAKTRISTDLQLNIDRYQRLFADCADIKMRRMALGQNKSRECFIAYIEVSVSNMLLETTALGRALGIPGLRLRNRIPRNQSVDPERGLQIPSK